MVRPIVLPRALGCFPSSAPANTPDDDGTGTGPGLMSWRPANIITETDISVTEWAAGGQPPVAPVLRDLGSMKRRRRQIAGAVDAGVCLCVSSVTTYRSIGGNDVAAN